MYSIDESFVGLAGMEGMRESRAAMGQDMRRKILDWTALPVCVGVGEPKTLAKLANHVAKKFALLDGVCDLTSMSDARKLWLLSRIGVGEVWRVERRIGAQLREMGIETVQQLKEAPPKAIRADRVTETGLPDSIPKIDDEPF